MNKYFSRLNKEYPLFNKCSWLLLSIAIIFYKISYHEMWKDEWQAWLVARDKGLWDMLSFLNYEGHPSLWYLYLKVWTLFPIKDEWALILGHSLLFIIVIYYLLVKLSLPSVWKILFALSYFISFEYGVVNRGYIWVVLLSLVIVDLINRNKNEWSLGVSLLLLCQTEVYGVIIAAAFSIYILLSDTGRSFRLSKKVKLLSLSLVGFILFIFTVYPRGNEDDFARAYNQSIFSLDVIKESIQGHVANVFAIGAIPDTAAYGSSVSGLLLSVLILTMLAFVFIRDRRSMLALGVGIFGFILFGIVIFTGGVRQWGMVYVLFMCMVFLSHHYLSIWKPTQFIGLSLLLIFPLIHGLKGWTKDFQIPFTNAKEAGLFIKNEVPVEVPVVVINKFETGPVGAYAERPLYELPDGKPFTYFKWLERVYIPTQTELTLFTKFKNVGGIVLVSPQAIDELRFPKARLWKTFSSENFKSENYWIYSIPLDQ